MLQPLIIAHSIRGAYQVFFVSRYSYVLDILALFQLLKDFSIKVTDSSLEHKKA